MRTDSCLGLVELFSQSGDPASWTDGEVGKVVITFSNVTHHSGFVISQTNPHHFVSSARAGGLAAFLDNRIQEK